MPQSDTEIPHLAFTHHRIGIHSTSIVRGSLNAAGQLDSNKQTNRRLQRLEPVLQTSGISSPELKQLLGFAYLNQAESEPSAKLANEYRMLALPLLAPSVSLPFDPRQSVAFGKLNFDLGRDMPLNLVSSALRSPQLNGRDLCNAKLLMAEYHFTTGQYQKAKNLLEELTTLRRNHLDWLLLAQCQSQLGDHAAQMTALLTATKINPRLWKVHQTLAEWFRMRGDDASARWHLLRAVPNQGNP